MSEAGQAPALADRVHTPIPITASHRAEYAALLAARSREDVLAMFGEVDGWHLVEERLAAGRGLMLASGHVGNWELGGAYLAARGLPISAVARHMANPLVDRYLTQTRERLGLN